MRSTFMTEHKHVSRARGASGLNVVLGCWLIASPWIFGYVVSASAFWNSIVVGALVALLALSRFSAPRSGTGLNWLSVLLGLWAIVSPWIYGYWGHEAAKWNSVAVGLAVAVVAMLAALGGRASSGSQHRGDPTPTVAR